MNRWQKDDSLFLSQPEKRNHQRLDAHLNVQLVIDGHKIKATSTNISCGGMFVNLKKHALGPQDGCELHINLPSNEEPVRVVGEVHRLEKGKLFGRKKGGVAIKFNELYNDNILAIDRFIKSKLS